MVSNLHAKPRLVVTGTSEIDKKIGGGIPAGSLTLLDGQSDAGKSVLAQQFVWGALNNSLKVAVYTTENTTVSLIRQMGTLGFDVTDFFLLRRLNIYPVPNAFDKDDASTVFDTLLSHIGSLDDFDLIVVDSLTAFVSHASEQQTLDFFSQAKGVCDNHRTLMMTMHSYAVNEQLLIRIRSICDAHLRLRVEEVGEQLLKVLEVAKIRGAAKNTGNVVSFDVQPGLGIRIIPVTKARA
jgi:flagellar protein FlaH